MKRILVIIIALMLIGCSSRKPIESKTIVDKELQIDSSFVSKTSEAINDSLIVSVQSSSTGNKNIDSIVNSEIEKILSKIDTKKVSGQNQLSFSYDKLAKVLIAYGKLGKTENIEIKKNKFDKNHSTKVEQIPVKYIPKWVKILAGIGIFYLLKLVVDLVLWFYKNYTRILSFL